MALTAQQQAELAALVAAYGAAYAKVEEVTLSHVESLIRRLANLWFSPGAVTPVVRELADYMNEQQQVSLDLTTEYLNNVFEAMEVKVPQRQLLAPAKRVSRLRGIDDILEWERPARDARVLRLLGLDELEANEKALWRAKRQASMDLMLAKREAERQRWGLSEDITGYRRILHPELTQSGPCGLCVAAATRIYQKAELRPLHNGCACSVLPVTDSKDPGLLMNDEDLDVFLAELYGEAGSTRREDLQRVRFDVLPHGELGPVLVSPKNKNRTKKQTKSLAEQGLDPQRVFDIQSRLVEKFERELAEGRDVNLGALEFHRRTAAEYAKRLGIDYAA